MSRIYSAKRVAGIWVLPGAPRPSPEPNEFWKMVLFIVTAAVLLAIGGTIYGAPT